MPRNPFKANKKAKLLELTTKLDEWLKSFGADDFFEELASGRHDLHTYCLSHGLSARLLEKHLRSDPKLHAEYMACKELFGKALNSRVFVATENPGDNPFELNKHYFVTANLMRLSRQVKIDINDERLIYLRNQATAEQSIKIVFAPPTLTEEEVKLLTAPVPDPDSATIATDPDLPEDTGDELFDIEHDPDPMRKADALFAKLTGEADEYESNAEERDQHNQD